MSADTNPADAAPWALAYLEAQDADDQAGIDALLLDVPKRIACERLGGVAVGLLIELCTVTGFSPGEWLANAHAQHNGMGAA